MKSISLFLNGTGVFGQKYRRLMSSDTARSGLYMYGIHLANKARLHAPLMISDSDILSKNSFFHFVMTVRVIVVVIAGDIKRRLKNFKVVNEDEATVSTVVGLVKQRALNELCLKDEAPIKVGIADHDNQPLDMDEEYWSGMKIRQFAVKERCRFTVTVPLDLPTIRLALPIEDQNTKQMKRRRDESHDDEDIKVAKQDEDAPAKKRKLAVRELKRKPKCHTYETTRVSASRK